MGRTGSNGHLRDICQTNKRYDFTKGLNTQPLPTDHARGRVGVTRSCQGHACFRRLLVSLDLPTAISPQIFRRLSAYARCDFLMQMVAHQYYHAVCLVDNSPNFPVSGCLFNICPMIPGGGDLAAVLTPAASGHAVIERVSNSTITTPRQSMAQWAANRVEPCTRLLPPGRRGCDTCCDDVLLPRFVTQGCNLPQRQLSGAT